MRLHAAAGLAGLLAILPAFPVSGQEVSVELEVEHGPGAAACPDAQAFRRRVATRLGYDPFVDSEGERRVEIRIDATQEGRVARVTMEERGSTRGERELRSRREDACAELADAITMAIVIAIDPPPPAELEVVTSHRSPPRSDDAIIASRVPPPLVPQPQPSEDEAQEEPIHARLTAAVDGIVGSAPFLTGGLSLGGGLRWRALSVDLAVRIELPVSTTSAGASFETFLFSAALLPCGHFEVLTLCGVLRGGPLRTSDQAGDNGEITTPWVGLGGRIGFEILLEQQLAVWAALEITATLAQTNLRIDSSTVWTTEPAAGALSLGFLFRP